MTGNWKQPQGRVNTTTFGVPAAPNMQTSIQAQKTQVGMPQGATLSEADQYQNYFKTSHSFIEEQRAFLVQEHLTWQSKRKTASKVMGGMAVAGTLTGWMTAAAVGSTAVMCAPLLFTVAAVGAVGWLATKTFGLVKNSAYKGDRRDFTNAQKDLEQASQLIKNNPSYIQNINVSRIASRMEDFSDIAENRTKNIFGWSKRFNKPNQLPVYLNGEKLKKFRANTQMFAQQKTNGQYVRGPKQTKNKKHLL